jgi:DNA polymerase-3 subunit delta'
MPHAVMLCGARGLGKQHFCRALAQSLLCTSPTGHGAGCGLCQSCLLFVAGSHPDWLQVLPEEDARSIKIEQIRDLSAELALTPQYNQGKIACIEPADQLTMAAANSLLKTLEEPPGGTLIVLITSRPNALPATIRSRCQEVRLLAPSIIDGSRWLVDKGSEVEIAEALWLARGAPLQAAELLESTGNTAFGEWLQDWVALLRGEVGVVQIAEGWAKLERRELFERLSRVTSQMLRSGLYQDDSGQNLPLMQPLRGLNGLINSRNLFAFRDVLQERIARDVPGLNDQSLVEGLLFDARRLLSNNSNHSS